MVRRFSIDLFCRIVDNYGDIGVCWRLAKQLTAVYPYPVRLIVDNFEVFKKIEPALDITQAVQTLNCVTILRWTEADLKVHYETPAHAVIEAFGCDLPPQVIQKMQKKMLHPVWIDLEYLSAENWVEECHAIPSFHPATGLEKTLFFPGFTDKTGGLIREENLIQERSNFCGDKSAQAAWREAHHIPQREDGVLDMSLFCYPSAPLEYLADSGRALRLFVPEGVILPTLPSVEIYRVPFLLQADYDRLLWTCDLNFVRGEDSWVRAIWAGKPFIWQAYPQDNGTSLVKVRAFLARYSQGLTTSDAETLADLHVMWNLGDREGKSGSRSWQDLLQNLPVFSDHALAWSGRQTEQTDCATALTRFIRSQLDKQAG